MPTGPSEAPWAHGIPRLPVRIISAVLSIRCLHQGVRPSRVLQVSRQVRARVRAAAEAGPAVFSPRPLCAVEVLGEVFGVAPDARE